jgi:hypothetical protein
VVGVVEDLEMVVEDHEVVVVEDLEIVVEDLEMVEMSLIPCCLTITNDLFG